MTKEKAIELGREEAIKNQVKIIIVDAPIENADDESGPFGYTTDHGLAILYKHATIVAMISPNGAVLDKTVLS